jgi:hypothetical protein
MSKDSMVFLSYANEDQKDARKIFEDLKGHGVNVWADFDSLRPGSKWKIAIKKAIEESQYFLAVLSSNSSKKGFVQKEIAQALDILDEFPESDIYIIPIRLNECSPSHDKLKELHWVDMFPTWDDGISRILSVVAPFIKKPDIKISDIEQSEDNQEIDINYILSQKNKENILIKDGIEIPYLESKSTRGPAECTIYANIYSRFYEKAYYLETMFMAITIDDLKKIITEYYTIFRYAHYVSAFGINQETCSWFGFGPLNFIKTLEMQNYRYSKLIKNNDYIHHREAACFIDEMNDVIFYIHSQPNTKNADDELLTLNYVNVGFVFNKLPYNNIYHKFFEMIGSIPDSVEEVNHPLTIAKKIDTKFKKEGYVITDFDEEHDGWVCGIFGKNFKGAKISQIHNENIIVNFNQYHLMEDNCEHKIVSMQATTLPAANFPAIIINYKGDWNII